MARALTAVLGDARDRADLGPGFGPELTGAEVRYLMTKEWARFPDDILWRRSKLGLTMAPADRERAGGVHGDGGVTWSIIMRPSTAPRLSRG